MLFDKKKACNSIIGVSGNIHQRTHFVKKFLLRKLIMFIKCWPHDCVIRGCFKNITDIIALLFRHPEISPPDGVKAKIWRNFISQIEIHGQKKMRDLKNSHHDFKLLVKTRQWKWVRIMLHKRLKILSLFEQRNNNLPNGVL